MKIKLTHPLISCICITDNRTDLLLKSIICFDTQNYPNKELVISFPEGDQNTLPLIENIIQLSGMNIVYQIRANHLSLGEAKNQAILKAKGEYICIWDDDDYYHPKRLLHQYNTMKTKAIFPEATIIKKIMLFDAMKQKSYLSFEYDWGGTLLCKKDILLYHPFLDQNVGEDAAIIRYLSSKSLIHYIEDSSFLYIFLYHGKNALDYYHFAYYVKRSELLDKASKNWMRSLLYPKVELSPT